MSLDLSLTFITTSSEISSATGPQVVKELAPWLVTTPFEISLSNGPPSPVLE